jgi:hypothetical protein
MPIMGDLASALPLGERPSRATHGSGAIILIGLTLLVRADRAFAGTGLARDGAMWTGSWMPPSEPPGPACLLFLELSRPRQAEADEAISLLRGS